MAVLIFKNQELETGLSVRDLTPIVDGLIHGTSPIPNVDIDEINNASNYLYATNNLVCVLDGGSPTGDRFGDPEVRVNGFWKVSDTSTDGTEFSKYQRFETSADVELFSPGRVSIKIRESDKENVEEVYRAKGLSKPAYGMLLVVLNFVNADGEQRKEFAYLMKYTHNPLFSAATVFNPGLFVAGKNVYRSPPYSAETFFIPEMSSSFVYNFFETQEADYDVYDRRDYKRQKISDIPKYIRLTWNKPPFDFNRFDVENAVIGLDDFRRAGQDLFVDLNGGNTVPQFQQPQSALTSQPQTSQTAPLPNRIDSAVTTQTNTQPSYSGTSFRMLGVVLSQAAGATDISQHMADESSRTGIATAEAFDGRTTFNLPEGDQAALQAVAEDSFRTTAPRDVVDSFQTYAPRELDLVLSVARDSDYAGYVIEKSRLTEEGDLEVVDIIAVAGKDTTEFLDWKIAYGETYRYRIRTVFRFVNKHQLSMFSDTDTALTRKQSVSYVDSNTLINANKTLYFDSVYSDPVEVQATEAVRPNPPINVRLFPKSSERTIFITWNQKNQNRDVVGFNIYRKTLIEKDQNFTRLNTEAIGIRENGYFDTDIDVGVDYIYAIEALDFHGNFSKLSAQYYTKVQEVVIDKRIREYQQRFFDVEGLELGETLEDEVSGLISFKKGFNINVNPLYQGTDQNNTFVIRVTCLDTGHKKEIKLNFKTQTIYHMTGYTPPQRQQYLPFPGATGFFDAETLAILRRQFGNG